MKKAISLVLCLLLAVGLFAACGNTDEPQTTVPAAPDETTDGLHVVCSIFPQYDICRALMGGKGTLSILLDSKTDLHNYSPTTEDILTISDCDLFIYVGGESDTWADSVIATAQNEDLQTLKLIETVNAVEEELLPGMEAEEEEGEDEGPEYDEHVWTSLRNMISITEAIRDKLCEMDRENADLYAANAEAYLAKLTELEARYAETIAGAKTKTLVFADRYPFRYLADDYDLTCYGAFAGCSAESEASFGTMAKLVAAVKDNGLRFVLKIEGSDGKIAETVASQSGAEIRTLNSCQCVSADEMENGVTYLSIMEDNLSVLQEVLN